MLVSASSILIISGSLVVFGRRVWCSGWYTYGTISHYRRTVSRITLKISEDSDGSYQNSKQPVSALFETQRNILG